MLKYLLQLVTPLDCTAKKCLFQKKVQDEIKNKQLHAIHVCLKNDAVTGDVGKVLFAIPNTDEHDVASFKKWLREPLVSPFGSNTECFRVTYIAGILYS